MLTCATVTTSIPPVIASVAWQSPRPKRTILQPYLSLRVFSPVIARKCNDRGNPTTLPVTTSIPPPVIAKERQRPRQSHNLTCHCERQRGNPQDQSGQSHPFTALSTIPLCHIFFICKVPPATFFEHLFGFFSIIQSKP